MLRIPVHTTESVPHAASQLTPAGRFAEHAEDDAGVSPRAAYAAFGWVLAFLAWHVVWAVTGLPFPHHHYHGAARMRMWRVDAIMVVMWAVGIPLPLALARPWGRRVPRWMLLWAAWIGCALLGARGIAGTATDVLFVAGGPMFGLAALTYQRAFPRRRSAENPAR